MATITPKWLQGLLPNKGFSTFDKLQTYLGSAGDGKVWHHIVEQCQTKFKRSAFPETQVQNINNAFAIPHGPGSIHEKISAYFSSIDPRISGNKTIRDWLNDKSFDFQFEFGFNVLKRYGEIKATKKGWVFIPF